jgi:hypothetical protein
MPRGPRLDVADALYHVIGRGVERRPIFRTEPDRIDFLRRLQGLAVSTWRKRMKTTAAQEIYKQRAPIS